MNLSPNSTNETLSFGRKGGGEQGLGDKEGESKDWEKRRARATNVYVSLLLSHRI
jgi:hypothetical protein